MPSYRIVLVQVARTAKPRLNDFHAQDVGGQRLHVYKGRTYDESELDQLHADQRHIATKARVNYEYYMGAMVHVEPDPIDWKAVAQTYAKDLTEAQDALEALQPGGAPAPKEISTPHEGGVVDGAAGPGTPGPAPAPSATTEPSPAAPTGAPAPAPTGTPRGTITPPAPAAGQAPPPALKKRARRAAKPKPPTEPQTP